MSTSPLIDDSYSVLTTHARSFRWGAIFLPKANAHRAAVLYAFCRLVDDTVDEAESVEEAKIALQILRQEWDNTQPPRPLVQAMQHIAETPTAKDAVSALMDGVATDLSAVVVPDDRSLLRYCYRVAGTVGLLMCVVLDVTDPDAHAFAIDLGIGMQLTNICRDVLEDAHMNRVYLPESRLQASQTSATSLLGDTARPEQVAEVVSSLLELSEVYYKSAMSGMCFIPQRTRLGIYVAAKLYRAIGLKLKRRNSDPLRGRTIVHWSEKIVWVGIAIMAWLVSFFRVPIPHHQALHKHLDRLPGVK